MDYKDKIKKLLALAESPNENEAQAALLKARQLMAEHVSKDGLETAGVVFQRHRRAAAHLQGIGPASVRVPEARRSAGAVLRCGEQSENPRDVRASWHLRGPL